MKKYIKYIAAALAALACVGARAESTSLMSPNGKLKVDIETGPCLSISATLDGKLMVKDVKVSLKTPRQTLCAGMPYSLDRRFFKSGSPAENFNQLEFSYTDAGYKVYVRAYDNAFAYCVELKAHPRTDAIIDERLEMDIPHAVALPRQTLPVIFSASNPALGRIALLETDDPDYPKFRVNISNRGKRLSGFFKKIPSGDEFEQPYIYKVDGRAKILPWRAFIPVSGYADENIDILKARLQSADTSGEKKCLNK